MAVPAGSIQSAAHRGRRGIQGKCQQQLRGIPFTRGPLAYKDEVFPGAQPAILDRDLFDAVQAKLDDQTNNYTALRRKSEALSGSSSTTGQLDW